MAERTDYRRHGRRCINISLVRRPRPSSRPERRQMRQTGRCTEVIHARQASAKRPEWGRHDPVLSIILRFLRRNVAERYGVVDDWACSACCSQRVIRDLSVHGLPVDVHTASRIHTFLPAKMVIGRQLASETFMAVSPPLLGTGSIVRHVRLWESHSWNHCRWIAARRRRSFLLPGGRGHRAAARAAVLVKGNPFFFHALELIRLSSPIIDHHHIRDADFESERWQQYRPIGSMGKTSPC